MSFLLDVERSFSGKQWVKREGDERLAITLAQRLNISPLSAQVLAARGVEMETAQQFLHPTLRDLLPDPSGFKGMSEAVTRICDAIVNKEKIAIFGDYDVDGATSSSVLKRFFNAINVPALIYIPDRIKEGYGPNVDAFDVLKAQGVDLVITVDCGTTSFEPLTHAQTIGLDVVVVDHHEAEVSLPPAVAVINPKRLDESGEFGYLAAVGMAFILVVGLNRGLRERDYFKTAQIKEPDIRNLLDLVALGTVCDVVPLKGVNRAFVTQGLKVMAQRQNAGLVALSEVASINEKLSSYHAGYVLGPRVNAGGRVGESWLGSELLTTDNPHRASEIAQRLDLYNKERQELEQIVLDDAIVQVEKTEQKSFVVATGQGWHPGVIGIVASRLKERYSLPAAVIAFEDGVGHGSARSVTGVDLGSLVIAARQKGLLVKGGGHAMAAGFTVNQSDLADFMAFMNERISSQIKENNVLPTYAADSIISLQAATPALVEELEDIGPFGAGNPQPRFVLSHSRIIKADVVGRDHVRCVLGDQHGGQLKAIAFRALDTDLGQGILAAVGKTLHIAGRLKLDTWGGYTSVQLLIDDAAPVRSA